MRTWFERGVNRLHRLHRLFSCQQKLFLPTDSTDNTKFFSQQITQIIFLPTEIIFANGQHGQHEVFFSQQITQITQIVFRDEETTNNTNNTNHSCYSCRSLLKEKNPCNLCNPLTKDKNSCSSCYPLAKEKIREICVIC